MAEGYDAELLLALSEDLVSRNEFGALRDEALRLGRSPLELLQAQGRLSAETFARLRPGTRLAPSPSPRPPRMTTFFPSLNGSGTDRCDSLGRAAWAASSSPMTLACAAKWPSSLSAATYGTQPEGAWSVSAETSGVGDRRAHAARSLCPHARRCEPSGRCTNTDRAVRTASIRYFETLDLTFRNDSRISSWKGFHSLIVSINSNRLEFTPTCRTKCTSLTP